MRMPGVLESAVVGVQGRRRRRERVHAVLRARARSRAGNRRPRRQRQLADHQRIRSFSVWTDGPLPRTEGTKKLKRARDQGVGGRRARRPRPRRTTIRCKSLLAKFAGRAQLDGATSIEGLGLSSLERVELMVALEDQFQTRIDETKFAGAKTLDELSALIESAPRGRRRRRAGGLPVVESRRGRCGSSGARQPGDVDPAAGADLRLGPRERPRTPRRPRRPGRVRGQPPEPFRRAGDPDGAAWHSARAGARRRWPRSSSRRTSSRKGFRRGRCSRTALNYYLSAFFFNTFPLPQREAGARQTLRYIGEVTGDGFSVLIFPGGRAIGERRHQAVPRRHRHDRLAARLAGRAGAA